VSTVHRTHRIDASLFDIFLFTNRDGTALIPLPDASSTDGLVRFGAVASDAEEQFESDIFHYGQRIGAWLKRCGWLLGFGLFSAMLQPRSGLLE
jgi:hypothetical protein